LKATQLRTYIVRPALALLPPALATRFAEDLLISTCAVESALGTYIHQIAGPALGIFQMDPETLVGLWAWARVDARWMPAFRAVGVLPELATPPNDAILYNLRLAVILARLYYYRDPQPFPSVSSETNLWSIYKRVWNTELGATTLSEFKSALMTTDIV